MSITDELREYASVSWNPWPEARDRLLQMCDRIDAEHISIVDQTRNKAWNEGFDDGYASVDNWLAQHEDAMSEHGWIRLPKDADGVPIHIGDELDGYGYPKGGAYCKAIVNEVTILAGPKDSSYRSWLMWDATEVRHHHEPTVEDVLREFGEKYCDTIDGCAEESELFAEYAAKLQLRGDGE